MADPIDPDIYARLAALEWKVSELYQIVDRVAPSHRESVEASLPAEVVELIQAGEREEAIRRLLVLEGVSMQVATARVSAYGR